MFVCVCVCALVLLLSLFLFLLYVCKIIKQLKIVRKPLFIFLNLKCVQYIRIFLSMCHFYSIMGSDKNEVQISELNITPRYRVLIIIIITLN